MATAVKRRSRYTNYSRVPYDAYDGSAARQLQREEVLRPRPMVRPRERAVVRPRVRGREVKKGYWGVNRFGINLEFKI